MTLIELNDLSKSYGPREVLRKLGWRVDYYLPHRLDEGYGLSEANAASTTNSAVSQRSELILSATLPNIFKLEIPNDFTPSGLSGGQPPIVSLVKVHEEGLPPVAGFHGV